MNHDFKPFDRVLVRDADDDVWRCQFYSHPYGELHACLNGVHVQCIPFAGNEALLGTKDEPEPKFKKGDAVLVWSDDSPGKRVRVYSYFRDGKHFTYNFYSPSSPARWDHAEKFIPATVEG